MKRNYLKKIFLAFLFLQVSFYAQAQEPDEPIAALDTEVETEVEVEAEAGIGQTAGVVALSAGAGANFPNSNTAVMLSGALSQATGVPSNGIVGPGNNGDNTAEFNTATEWPSNSATNSTDVNFFLAESETEVESEVEVEVNDGAAVATAGSSVGAAGVAASKYTTADGEIKVWPTNTVTSVDAVTSVSSMVSKVNVEFINEPTPVVSGSGQGALFGPVNNPTEGNDYFQNSSFDVNDLPFGIVYAVEGDEPVSQVETDTETEVETEAEAEAETAPGAAAAAATGGTATSVAGDFGVAISTSSVITSVSTSEVNDEEPAIFAEIEPIANNSENTGSGNENVLWNPSSTSQGNTNGFSVAGATNSLNPTFQITASELADVPTEENGKGLNSFESEAEAEVEVEAEVDNGAASVAAIAIAGTGANGSASSVSGSSTTTASTSTLNHTGTAQRENDQIFFSESRNEELLEGQPAASAEATAEAEAEANQPLPSASGDASSTALGDAFSFGSLVLEDFNESTIMGPTQSNGSQGITNRAMIENYGVNGVVQQGAGFSTLNAVAFAAQSFGEVEAEAEAEAEAEVGFNAAAAGAGSSAVQGKSGILPFDASTASSSSTSTKVFDGEENLETQNDSFVPEGNTEYPDIAGDLSDYEFEVEVETEVEAEVGLNSSAVAVSAAGAGYEGLVLSTKYQTTPYAAAGAAAAGQTVTTSITMPAGNAAGNVVASATAEDSESRGVSVAVAVAGVPSIAGIENEQEAESEGAGFASVSVSIYTDPANAQNAILLGGYQSTPDADLGQDEGGSLNDGIGEAEAEAESEAEAGYGVAAAAASAAASGPFAKSESFTSTSTLSYELGYDFLDDLFVITEASAIRTAADSTIVEIKFNGFGYTSFSIQQKDTNGTFVEIGTLDRATPDIWESYIFTVNNVDPNLPQQFKVVPAEDTSDEVILTLGGSELCTEVIEIPDANFKSLLVGNTSINTNGDMEIQCSEASSYKGELVYPQSGITDLTGIEAFIQVTEINFSNNSITAVDLSELLLLTSINLIGNDLTMLNVDNNNNLTTLRVGGNALTSLSGVTDLDALVILDARNNDLSSLDVSNNPILKTLNLNNNDLTTLDVSGNTQLTTLEANGNNLTALDLSGNPALQVIKLRNNNLDTLDLRNGNNITLENEDLDLINNPNLECVSVDTVSYAAATFFNIDAQTQFSNNCASPNEPNQAPSAVCESITVGLGEDGSVTITASDVDGGSFDVDGTITYDISQSTFNCDNLGENEVTLTITDDDGVTDSCTATVTVEQGSSIVVNIPEEVTAEAELDQCSAVVEISVSATSACGDLEISSDEPENNVYPVGTTVVTFTVVNLDGTTTTYTTNVVVADTQAPATDCIEDQNVQIQSSALYTLPDYGAEGVVLFTDNCTDTEFTYVQTPLAGEELGGGDYTITVEAQDASGNSTTCTFNLTVDATLNVASSTLNNFSFYPNPTTSDLRINTSSNLESIKIHSVTGQLVISQLSSEKRVNVDALAKGMYLMTVTDTEGNTATKQFIKK